MQCPACHSESPDNFRFCGHCGAALGPQPAPAPVAVAPHEDDLTERRRLTVVFCDLVGSTQLSTLLDPEDMQVVLQQYHALAGDVIGARGGYVAQHLGDGLLAYFGFPEAREDDAVRAIQTALQISDELTRSTPAVALPEAFELRVRVGIHTGEVVTALVGRGAQSERLALGEVPNIAARLQSLATPGEVVVSENTERLARTYFDFTPMGPQTLRGAARPLACFRARRRRLKDTAGFEAGEVLIGRRVELAALHAAFASARDEGLRLLKLVGEPGMGKTRLCAALRESLAVDAVRWFTARCAADGSGSFLFPLADLLRDWAELDEVHEPQAQSLVLKARLDALPDAERETTWRALCQLLQIAPPPGEVWLDERPEQQKGLIFEALLGWLSAQNAYGPLVLQIEDMHWADPSTLEWLGSLPDTLRVLVMLTTRPPASGGDPLAALPGASLSLLPMTQDDAAALVHQCSGAIAEPLLQRIVARAAGVPLFVQELARLVSETGEGASTDAALPDRLRDLFTIRLDRLGPAKRIASLAAVVGPEFTAPLLGKVVDLPPAELAAQLAVLVEAGVITPLDDDDTFGFKHALIRDSALANMLRRSLRSSHRRVAEVLEAEFPDECSARPERLARHWGEAQDVARALNYFAVACERARGVYANAEAITLYREALALAAQPGETPTALLADTLLELQEGLGEVLTMMRETGEAVATLRAVLSQLAPTDPLRRARLLRKIGLASRDDHDKGIPLLESALAALGAHPTDGQERWWREWLQIKFELAKTYYQLVRVMEMKAVAQEIEPLLADYGTPQQAAELANQLMLIELRESRFGPSETALTHARHFLQAALAADDLPLAASASAALGMILTSHDVLEEAADAFMAALDLCVRAGHRAAEIRALVYFAVVRRRQDDVAATEALSQQARALAEAGGMGVYVSTAEANLAWVAWKRGDVSAARTLAEQALTGLRAASARSPYFWTALLPLAAMAFADDELELCAEYLEAMTARDQQLLRPAMMASLAALGSSTGSERAAACAEALREAAAGRYL